jgi:hypothetical protein
VTANQALEKIVEKEKRMQQEDETDSNDLLLKLHIAEYQTITFRNTNFITLQCALFPILLAFLVFVANFWNSFDHSILVWGSLLFAQFLGLLWYWFRYEQYRNICYIEHELRSRVESIINEPCRFWEYEKYLCNIRGSGPMWYECVIPIVAINTIIIIGMIRYPLTMIDRYGLLINIVFAPLLAWVTLIVYRIRKGFFGR